MIATTSSIFSKPTRIKEFKAFLMDRGCEVLPPTNPWERLRFRAEGRTNVAYADKNGAISLVGPDIVPAAKSFLNGRHWKPDGAAPKESLSSRKRRMIVARLVERDGTDCFYCGEPLGEDITHEHLFSRSHGGNGHVCNGALAHEDCNKRAANLSVVEKVKLREQMRGERHTARMKALCRDILADLDSEGHQRTERLPIAEVVPLLNQVEDWVESAEQPAGAYWVWKHARQCLCQQKHRYVIGENSHSYRLDLGQAPGGCFVCGAPAGTRYGRMTPLFHWSLPVCKRHSDGPDKVPFPKDPPPEALITPDIRRWLDRHERIETVG